MKVIFLDFDGVLNSTRSALALGGFGFPPRSDDQGYDPMLDPIAVGLLRRLVEETGCKIVVSSTWRLGSKLSDFHRIFDCYGWPTVTVVIGKTSQLHLPYKIARTEGRGLECDQWVEDCDREVEDFVCVDDDSDFTAAQKEAGRFIHVDRTTGLSVSHFDAIRARFNNCALKFSEAA